MTLLWEAFLEDYADEVFDWSLRFTLEIFWHYCQDGNKAVYEFLNNRAPNKEGDGEPGRFDDMGDDSWFHDPDTGDTFNIEAKWKGCHEADAQEAIEKLWPNLF